MNVEGIHSLSFHSLEGVEKMEMGPADKIQISEMAQLMEKISDLPAVSPEKVEEIRRQYEAGTYLNEAHLEIAMERLLEEL